MGRVRNTLFALAVASTATISTSAAAADDLTVTPATTHLDTTNESLCAISPSSRHVAWVGSDLETWETLDRVSGVRTSVPRDAIWNVDVQLADDGHTLLQLLNSGNRDTLTLIDLRTGDQTLIYDIGQSSRTDGRHIWTAAMADDASAITWVQRTLGSTGDATWEVRQWQRSSGAIATLRSMQVDRDEPEYPGGLPRADWFTAPLEHFPSPAALRLLDPTPPAGHLSPVLSAISTDRTRMLWNAGDQLVFASSAGTTLSTHPIPVPAAVEVFPSRTLDRALVVVQPLEGDAFTLDIRPDGGRRTIAAPFWTPLEVFPYRTHQGSVCAGSADGSEVVAAQRTDGELGLHLFDLDREAPRSVTTDEVSGQQLTGQIERLYRAYFGRSPDAAGLAYWRTQRASGRSLGSISSEFAGSAEFIGRYGQLSDSEFVALVYENVLDRAPEPAGRDFWVGQLAAGSSRGAVMVGFSEAEEFIIRTGTAKPVDRPIDAAVNRLYRAYLGRDGDDGGLTFWVGEIEDGRSTLIDVSNGFAEAPEFVARSGQLDDAGFVDFVYEQVLGRPSEPAGRSFWIGQIANGMTRGELMLEFSESVEFILGTDSIPA